MSSFLTNVGPLLDGLAGSSPASTGRGEVFEELWGHLTRMAFVLLDSECNELFASPAAEHRVDGPGRATLIEGLKRGELTGPLPGGDSQELGSFFWAPMDGGGWFGVFGPPLDSERTSAEDGLDPLTGLMNRRHFDEEVSSLAAEAFAQDQDVFALYIDLDRFKIVNDSLGHSAGDGLLKRVAKRLCRATRREDHLFRMGGDEFVAVGYSESAEECAQHIADRVVDLIGRPFILEGQQVSVGASVGVATHRGELSSPHALLQQADIAMYASKHRGRGQVQHFCPQMLSEIEARRELEADLRRAILLDQFEVHYQPQYDLDAETLCALEALVRWNRPGHGAVSPGEFIPLAEQTGLIHSIGAWVLDQSLSAAASWPSHLRVSVNVSAAQLESEDFIRTVDLALQKHDVAPHRLEVELTEQVLVSRGDVVLVRMHELQSRGVRVSMDDFGMGQSSIGYLRQFPFDVIKFDPSFVRTAPDDTRADQIVGAIAELGRSLGVTILAEGVESEEQLERIRTRGCQAVQGFYLGRPMPVEELAPFFDAESARSEDKAL